jgi:hypothetical protein
MRGQRKKEKALPKFICRLVTRLVTSPVSPPARGPSDKGLSMMQIKNRWWWLLLNNNKKRNPPPSSQIHNHRSTSRLSSPPQPQEPQEAKTITDPNCSFSRRNVFHFVWRLLRYTIPLSSSTVVLLFFSVFYFGYNGNLLDVYYLKKYCLQYLNHFIYIISYITTIPFCISDNSRILLIPHMNTTHTKKKPKKLISTVGSLHIDYIRVLFNWWYKVVLCN